MREARCTHSAHWTALTPGSCYCMHFDGWRKLKSISGKSSMPVDEIWADRNHRAENADVVNMDKVRMLQFIARMTLLENTIGHLPKKSAARPRDSKRDWGERMVEVRMLSSRRSSKCCTLSALKCCKSCLAVKFCTPFWRSSLLLRPLLLRNLTACL